ncbi:hypothetical protein ACP70R_007451 [Stipagrostis hirtigluma subsp. patula]
MGSGTGASGESRSPPLPARIPRGHGALPSRPPVAVARTRCSTKCLLPPEPPRHDAGRSWADLPFDILGVVAGRLPLVEDRARMRSVCRAWRAAARLHWPPSPPLPLLVFSNFAFSSLCPGRGMTGIRHIPLPEEERVSGHIRCVGAFEGWLVVMDPRKSCYSADRRCFLINASYRAVIHLPPPSPGKHVGGDSHTRSLPIINDSGEVHCSINARKYALWPSKVILSSSPDSGSNCTVAAISRHMGGPQLALWRPGMTSWCVCHGGCIYIHSDIAFYQGKLYMISMLTLRIYAFEISEDDSGLIVSRVERCVTEELRNVMYSWLKWWKLVEWNGKLLLIVTSFSGAECWRVISKVRVLEVDFSTYPVKFNEINSLDGDCIFISTCSSKSFRACLYDGVEDDVIYFVDCCLYPVKNVPLIDKFVYNMRDGTVAPFAAGISDENLRAPDGRPMNPTWLFPSE